MKSKELNLFYMDNGQTIEAIEKQKTKKSKERVKRIKQNKKREDEEFNSELDEAIKMTNRNKLKKEEEKRKRQSIQERKRKKRAKRIKTILKLLLLLGIIIGSTVFALTSPIFNIKEIEVVNNSSVTSEEIESLSGLKKGENLFRFLGSQVAKNIKENPYIKDIKISRKIPSKVQIMVEERVASFSVSFMGTYAYIDTQGYILKISEDSNSIPILNGVTTTEEKMVPGNRLEFEDLEKLEDVLKIMNVMSDNNLGDKITSIDISNKTEYILYLEEELKTIHLGDASNLENKILYVLSIMEKEKGKEGTIYTNGDLNNKFRPYFREKV